MTTPDDDSYLRRLQRRKRLARRLLLGAGLLVLLLMGFFVIGGTASGAQGATLVAVTAILYILGEKVFQWSDRVHAAEKRAAKGADAEDEVRAILAGLKPEDFLVINDAPSASGNIDHLVIARHGGIFVVETKATKGRVDVKDGQLLIGGEPALRDPVRQVTRNATWVKERVGQLLGEQPYITAVLLFTDAFVAPRGPIRGVILARPSFLLNVLATPPASTSQRSKIWTNRTLLATSLAQRRDLPAA